MLKNPSTTTPLHPHRTKHRKYHQKSTKTASLRVSASCRVSSFRWNCRPWHEKSWRPSGPRSVILRQKSRVPINIAMIYQIVLIILVVTFASWELFFWVFVRIPTRWIEYAVLVLRSSFVVAATHNLKPDVTVVVGCQAPASHWALSISLLSVPLFAAQVCNPSNRWMNDDRSLEPECENGKKMARSMRMVDSFCQKFCDTQNTIQFSFTASDRPFWDFKKLPKGNKNYYRYISIN